MQAAALVSLLLLISSAAAAQDLDRRVAVKPGGLLQVDLDLGEETRWERVSLEVRSHDADEVWAVADLSGLGSSAVTFRLDHDDRVVRLYGRTRGLLSWILGGPGVHVKVWVPREYSVDLRCTSGPIRIEEIRGSVRARTLDAPIEVSGAEGEIRLRTRAGSVSVSDASGEVEIRTLEGSVELSWVNGDVEARTLLGQIQARHIEGLASLRSDSGEIGIREMRGPAEAKTERGAVFVSFSGAPEGLLETRRGSVQVQFPGHYGIDLEARSDAGTVEVEPGLKANGQRGDDYFVGTVNGGGSSLRIYTARGNVRVDRR